MGSFKVADKFRNLGKWFQRKLKKKNRDDDDLVEFGEDAFGRQQPHDGSGVTASRYDLRGSAPPDVSQLPLGPSEEDGWDVAHGGQLSRRMEDYSGHVESGWGVDGEWELEAYNEKETPEGTKTATTWRKETMTHNQDEDPLNPTQARTVTRCRQTEDFTWRGKSWEEYEKEQEEKARKKKEARKGKEMADRDHQTTTAGRRGRGSKKRPRTTSNNPVNPVGEQQQLPNAWCDSYCTDCLLPFAPGTFVCESGGCSSGSGEEARPGRAQPAWAGQRGAPAETAGRRRDRGTAFPAASGSSSCGAGDHCGVVGCTTCDANYYSAGFYHNHTGHVSPTPNHAAEYVIGQRSNRERNNHQAGRGHNNIDRRAARDKAAGGNDRRIRFGSRHSEYAYPAAGDYDDVSTATPSSSSVEDHDYDGHHYYHHYAPAAEQPLKWRQRNQWETRKWSPA